MLKVLLFLLVNTFLFTNSGYIKKNKSIFITRGLLGQSNIPTLGNYYGSSGNQRIFDTIGAGDNNPYVCSCNTGLCGVTHEQASPYISNLQGGGDNYEHNYPNTSNSGRNGIYNGNIANSNADSCNSNQEGDANACSNAYAQGTNYYIYQ